MLNIGQLDMMVNEYKRNFEPVDAKISEVNRVWAERVPASLSK